MRVDPLCTAIRFAPIGILFAAHCSNGHWPTDDECAERVMRYGFSVDLFRERPTSVLTHLFVHINSQHLLSNVFSFAATLMEYGNVFSHADICAEADNDDDEEEEDGAAGHRTPVSMSAQMRALWGEHNPFQACVRSAGAFTVWLVGGVLGGLGGQLLYNDSTVALRRERATRAALAVRAAQQSAAQDTEAHLLTTLSRHARILRQRVDAFNTSLAAQAQEAVNDAMMMCGASAGICALSGFSAVYYGRPITACCLVVPEVVALSVDLFNHYVALLSPRAQGKSGRAKLDAQQKALQSTWRTLMPGQTVGHAAHVGGFLAGAGIGYVWLWAQKRRLQKARDRRRAAA